MNWFHFVLHAWFNPRGNILPSSCPMYVKVKASRKDVRVPWCSDLLYTVSGSIPEGAFSIFMWHVCKIGVSITLTQEKMCGFPGVVVIASALHAEDLGFGPRGNLCYFFVTCNSLPWFPGVVVIASALHAKRSRVRSPREPFAIFFSPVCNVQPT